MDLLNNAEAAEYLRLVPKTLENWRIAGKGPRFLKVGRAVRYSKADLDRFLDGCGRHSTSDNTGDQL